MIEKHSLQCIQLHGDESQDFCKKIYKTGVEVIKSFRVDESFDFKLLKRLLVEVGFAEEDIRIYSYKETEHFFIDDGSQAHLPHMDKVNGMLMSLNVEAIKR